MDTLKRASARFLHTCWLLAFIIVPILSNAQQVIWVEAEKFDDPGGWTNDWQFIDQMGSPYILAIGLGIPVKDAVTKVEAEDPGRYRIWVRTVDWFPKDSPGKFELQINNKAGNTFGQSGKKGWTWEDGGIVSLKKFNEMRLKDLTGYYGRCDAIVFSSDLKWIPPADVNAIAELRLKHKAVSPKIKDMGTYDVVVVGGGVAGTLAAVAAARQGAKTVLIQNRGQLGGNTSHEIMVPPVGTRNILLEDDEKMFDPRETGLIEEVATYGPQRYFEAGKQFPGRLLRLVKSTPNLDLFLYTHATDVEMENKGKISSVVCIGLPEGQRFRFSGKLFIDCTGNGIVGIKAGAEFMHGREPKSMYQETKAPDVADPTTLGSSLKYWYLEQDQPQKFTTPSWSYHFDECADFGKGRHPKLSDVIDTQWMISLGGTSETYADAEAVRDDLLRLIYGIWDHVKNHCVELKEPAAKMKLAWVSHVAGVRESYRLKGDYVMTEHDVTQQPLLPDRVAYGGWGLDDHPSEGFFKKEYFNNYSHGGLLHSIPYRSLYSKNINNLMMAGRDISVTHVALTATRVMLTCGVIGQAAGTAAGMAIRKQTSPRGIYQSHMAELQQSLLKQGAYLIELPNQDPGDLALTASVKASSEVAPASNATNGYARARLRTAFPYAEFERNAWIPDINKTGPHWLELNWSVPQSFNVVHVVFENRGKLASKKFRIEQKNADKWETLRVIDNKEVFRRLVLPVGNVETEALRVVLEEEKPAGGICEIRVYNEPQHLVEMAARAYETMKQPDGTILLPWEKE